MSRRSSRKTDDQILKSEPIEDTITPSATPKRSRKAVKVETVEVVSKSSKSKKAQVSSSDEEDAPEEPPKIKINIVKSKAVFKEEKLPKAKKSATKRKARAEDEDDEGDDDVDDTKVKKKRKTKEEKEAEAMPLAARTAIGTLKKAMHIGAHISGAGGEFTASS